MSVADPDEPYWIEDGHAVTFGWFRDEIKIVQVYCPNQGTASLCNRRRTYCAVQRFFEVHGLEINLGRTTLNGPVRIAWTPVEGDSDFDEEFAQIWVVPIDDPDYRAMQEDAEDGAIPPDSPAPDVDSA